MRRLKSRRKRKPVVRRSSFPHPNWEIEEMVGESDHLSLDQLSGIVMIPNFEDQEDWHITKRRVIKSEGPVQDMMRREAAYGWIKE